MSSLLQAGAGGWVLLVNPASQSETREPLKQICLRETVVANQQTKSYNQQKAIPFDFPPALLPLGLPIFHPRPGATVTEFTNKKGRGHAVEKNKHKPSPTDRVRALASFLDILVTMPRNATKMDPAKQLMIKVKACQR